MLRVAELFIVAQPEVTSVLIIGRYDDYIGMINWLRNDNNRTSQGKKSPAFSKVVNDD